MWRFLVLAGFSGLFWRLGFFEYVDGLGVLLGMEIFDSFFREQRCDGNRWFPFLPSFLERSLLLASWFKGGF